ncbi:MAG: SAM-dependent methyltransferase [Methanobacteriaceae archaeon]|nr:SAM-dependent methyltransferase [Methanobacteriaceae archaeon]
MSNWKSEHDREHYYKKAKKEKYRSRASFKLLQLNNKFKIIKKGYKVLDLGAAPGGWSQVALELVGDDGLVLAVDLQRIRKFENENFHFIQGDFTQEETINHIYRILENKADVIISDASPKLSGIKDIDHLISIELAETVLNIAGEILKPGGNVIIKAFQGEEYKNLLQKIKKMFKLVKTTKPQSSKQKSSEMYIVAKGFR